MCLFEVTDMIRFLVCCSLILSALIGNVDKMHETGLPQKGSFGKPPWFDNVRAEYWACREGVCLIDMSTFAKFELRVRAFI